MDLPACLIMHALPRPSSCNDVCGTGNLCALLLHVVHIITAILEMQSLLCSFKQVLQALQALSLHTGKHKSGAHAACTSPAPLAEVGTHATGCCTAGHRNPERHVQLSHVPVSALRHGRRGLLCAGSGMQGLVYMQMARA